MADSAAAAQINALIDTLYLDMLDLVEQQVRCQLNIENAVVGGQLLVAKTRYTLGTNAVTIAQLPTENTPEFRALATVSTAHGSSSSSGDAASRSTALELTRHAVDKAAGYPEPLHWFGILLPQSMVAAQRLFRKSVEYSVECANVRLDLLKVIGNVLKLKKIVE